MKRKKAKKTARKSYVSNPARKRRARRAKVATRRSRRRYRSNPADSIKDIATLGVAGVASAILGAKAFSKLPISSLLQNLALMLVGGGVAILGRKKHSAFVGAGLGMIYAGGSRLLINKVPQLAGDFELSTDDQAAILTELSPDVETVEEMDGSFNGGFAGSFSGMNSPAM